ncbi:hypothetical protein [Actinomadura madurae]|uniref:hypothetical protein n=1 Tax=Actinomadura madurae TaxID=1993 RepID=UPI0020D21ABE|nr:hypothetical protein [Actinomadura madurae]MCP9952833.1 hypothetical protein [Actinomadura madurae]
MQQVVLLDPDALHEVERLGAEELPVVHRPELACPREQPGDRAFRLALRLPVGPAELADALQHPEPGPRHALDHLKQ